MRKLIIFVLLVVGLFPGCSCSDSYQQSVYERICVGHGKRIGFDYSFRKCIITMAVR